MGATQKVRFIEWHNPMAFQAAHYSKKRSPPGAGLFNSAGKAASAAEY
jgi:hypothetical protein